MHAEFYKLGFRLIHFMRYSIALVFLLALSAPALAAVNFSGIWTLDLKASDSPNPMMKQMGVPFIERKLAASLSLPPIPSEHFAAIYDFPDALL